MSSLKGTAERKAEIKSRRAYKKLCHNYSLSRGATVAGCSHNRIVFDKKAYKRWSDI